MNQPNIKKYFTKAGVELLVEIQDQLPIVADTAFPRMVEEALKRAYKAGYTQCGEDNDLDPEEDNDD